MSDEQYERYITWIRGAVVILGLFGLVFGVLYALVQP